MGVDEMQEALDLGFLDVHGEKTDSTSVRMTHEALQAIDALAAMDDVSRGEWVRDAVMARVRVKRRQYEYLEKVFGAATYTANTVHSDKEKA